MREKATHLMVDRKQREREKKKEGRARHPSKTCPSDPLPPTKTHLPQFHHLSIVYSNCESVDGPVH
jgi:hypothetical protein